MSDLDHEAAARLAVELSYIAQRYPQLAGDGGRIDRARKHLATLQAREKRLEALVRSLGKCPMCDAGRSWELKEDGTSTQVECFDCAGTGLVEAARKELENG